MITAQEARVITDTALFTPLEVLLTEVESAAKLGKNNIYSNLLSSQILDLQNLGFVITYTETTKCKISW